jgi:hypothetical protein
VCLFLFFFSAFILGRVVERQRVSFASEFLVWAGAFWLAAMLYFVLICALLDLARLANYFAHFFPAAVTADYARAKAVTLIASIAAVALLVAAGHANTYFLRTRTLDLNVPKKVTGPKTLNIVMASDIHLGSIIGASRLERIVAAINALRPDLIVLDGDIVDEDLTSVVKENVGEALKDLRAPLGVIAVTGNHEYIGGIGPAVAYLASHNVRLVRDDVLTVRGDVQIVGREDYSMARFAGTPRKPLSELMALVNARLPVILLDHEPHNLAEGASLGADVELCGHTHDGQLWPWNLLVFAFYDMSYGYRRVGNMHAYVSSGAGTWGPPVRVGTHPEIVRIVLHFE